MARGGRHLARRASRDQSGSFARAESGAVLAWLAILVPILLGLGTLAVDMSRLFSLQTQLQNAADALALAGAAELNGANTAITRSTNAVNNLVVNNQRFGANGAGQVAVSSIRFLQSLPGSDATAISNANITTDPAAARYVEVQVSPVTMNFILPFFNGIASATTGARAVAGMRQAVCQFTPMFVCNPWEGTGVSLEQAAADPSQQRRMIALRLRGGGSAQYAPGNYGFLDAPIGNGASALEDTIAQVNPPACYVQDGVSLRTGQISSVRDGFNVRFDLYAGNLNGVRGNPNYRPAQDVIKGYTGNNCNQNLSSQAYGLPRDACFATNTCTSLGASAGRMGAGDWDFVTYLQRNHNSPASVTIAGVTYAINYAAHTTAPAAPPSRYNVYRWEIDNSRIPNSNGYNQPNTQERGAPQCYNGGSVSGSPDRRILYVAILNCNALVAQGLLTSGNSSGPLPVAGFGRMFLTEPVETGSQSNIYAEFNGLVEPGRDAGVVRDLVQIYR